MALRNPVEKKLVCLAEHFPSMGKNSRDSSDSINILLKLKKLANFMADVFT